MSSRDSLNECAAAAGILKVIGARTTCSELRVEPIMQLGGGKVIEDQPQESEQQEPAPGASAGATAGEGEGEAQQG